MQRIKVPSVASTKLSLQWPGLNVAPRASPDVLNKIYECREDEKLLAKVTKKWRLRKGEIEQDRTLRMAIRGVRRVEEQAQIDLEALRSHRYIQRGERKAERAKAELVEANLPWWCPSPKNTPTGFAVPRLNPRGEHWPHEGGRQV